MKNMEILSAREYDIRDPVSRSIKKTSTIFMKCQSPGRFGYLAGFCYESMDNSGFIF